MGKDTAEQHVSDSHSRVHAKRQGYLVPLSSLDDASGKLDDYANMFTSRFNGGRVISDEEEFEVDLPKRRCGQVDGAGGCGEECRAPRTIEPRIPGGHFGPCPSTDAPGTSKSRCAFESLRYTIHKKSKLTDNTTHAACDDNMITIG